MGPLCVWFRVTRNGWSNYFPRWSPDGKWIVFTRSRSGIMLQPDSELWIVAARGGKPVAVVSEEDKRQFCLDHGAVGVINRKDFEIIWHEIFDKMGILVGNHMTVDWEIAAFKDLSKEGLP